MPRKAMCSYAGYNAHVRNLDFRLAMLPSVVDPADEED
jgi:hypothetical protein